jgi:quercetin dioxygenase-like cupin family protein
VTTPDDVCMGNAPRRHQVTTGRRRPGLATARAILHDARSGRGLPPVIGRLPMEVVMSKLVAALAAAAGLAFATSAVAQQPAPAPAQATSNIKRTMLQKVEVPGTGYDTFTAIAEVVANASIGRHTHPGPETGYLIEGEMTLLVDGQPPKPLKAGDSYQVPAGAIHDGKAGDRGVKVMAVYVVERGKPLATPAP